MPIKIASGAVTPETIYEASSKKETMDLNA